MPPIAVRRRHGGSASTIVVHVGASDEIAAILAGTGGVLRVADHPNLRRTVERLAQKNDLRRLAPGVFCPWDLSALPEVRARAVSAWDPNGVLTGRAAARLTFWPEISVPVVTVSSPTHRRAPVGVAVTRERLDPELVVSVEGVRVTVPALTALDLVPEVGGEGIDRVLRLRRASLADMAEALRLTPRRAGNQDRRAMLLDSRDEPWSEAEREGHRLLRAAHIVGWRSNVPVVADGDLYFLDIGFEALKLGIEIDGREVHKAENVTQFNHDRRKWTSVHNAGWCLLHFSAAHVFDEAEWTVDSVRRAVAQRAA